VPAFVGGAALMRGRPVSRSHQAHGLCRVTLLVPDSCAAGFRDLARVLRARLRERTAGPFGWRRLSPSTELMVDPRSCARYAIRDTRAAGAERYHWTVSVVGERDPVAAGRTGEFAEARSQAEAALVVYSAAGASCPDDADYGDGSLSPSKRLANASAAASTMKSTDNTTVSRSRSQLNILGS
jgi:hypothetical protein